MITRAEKLRLGIFLIASISVLIVVLLVLAGMHFMKPIDVYKIKFSESVSGLEIGAQVKYSGVRIGQVSDIEIDPEDLMTVVVTLSLRQGTPIKEDSEAVLTSLGITGLKFIEVKGGKKDTQLLKPGSFIKAGSSVIGTLEGKAQDIAIKSELLLTRLLDIASEKNIKNVNEIIANSNLIVKNSSELMEKHKTELDQGLKDLAVTMKELRETVQSVNKSAKVINRIVENAEPKTDHIFVMIEDTVKNVNAVSNKLAMVEKILADIEKTLDQFNNQLREARVGDIADSTKKAIDNLNATVVPLKETLEESKENIYRSSDALRKSLRNLEEFSAEIRDNPSLLLSSDPPSEKEVPDE